MKKRTLTNIALLLVAAGLAAFIASLPEGENPSPLEPLSHENPRAVSHLRLELGEDRIIELRRDDCGIPKQILFSLDSKYRSISDKGRIKSLQSISL